MTLRRRFTVYLLAVHLLFAGSAVVFLSDHPVWLVAVEAVFALTFVVGLRLTASFFRPLELIGAGARFLRDGEFGTRFRRTGQGDMDQLVAAYNVMVDRLRAERVRTEEQEHLLQRVLRESPGGVITLDVDGRIATVNPAAEALLGDGAEDLAGRDLGDLGTRLGRDLAELPLGESRLLRWQGRRRVRCQRLSFMDRGFPRHFLLLDELTAELHRTEKQAYEKLIRLMSHEVNNTSGAVQSLLRSSLAYARHLPEGDREDFVRALEVAIARTANLDSFMRGFAEVVRLPRPSPRPADPGELLHRLEILFRDRCRQQGIELRLESSAELPAATYDDVQMEQALINVIKNALEAAESVIEIGAGARGDRLVLTVRDDGPGLADDTPVFTPFFTTKPDGQGIGLTMVQEILLGHGFDFSLENDRRGGAVFTVTC